MGIVKSILPRPNISSASPIRPEDLANSGKSARPQSKINTKHPDLNCIRDSDNSNRATLRTDKKDPKCRKSKTDSEESQRPNPKMEKDGSSQAQLRSSMLEPMVEKSNTNELDSDLPRPNRSIVESSLPSERNGRNGSRVAQSKTNTELPNRPKPNTKELDPI